VSGPGGGEIDLRRRAAVRMGGRGDGDGGGDDK
jgi:hypothetical protein